MSGGALARLIVRRVYILVSSLASGTTQTLTLSRFVFSALSLARPFVRVASEGHACGRTPVPRCPACTLSHYCLRVLEVSLELCVDQLNEVNQKSAAVCDSRTLIGTYNQK